MDYVLFAVIVQQNLSITIIYQETLGVSFAINAISGLVIWGIALNYFGVQQTTWFC